MNEKMIIKVLPAEGSNPEFAPEKELQEGIECYGFVLMTFDQDHDIETAIMNNVSIMNVCDAVRENLHDEAISSLRQALVIAEGQIRAISMERESKANRMMKDISSGFAAHLMEEEDDE